jgi:hypothetical protein
MVVPGVNVTPRPSIRSAKFVETHDVSPTWCANCRGSLPPTVNFYQSCVRLGWLVKGDNGIYTGSGLQGVIPYVQ